VLEESCGVKTLDLQGRYSEPKSVSRPFLNFA
jgi:hypothetical protein